MKFSFRFCQFVIAGFILTFITSCSKDSDTSNSTNNQTTALFNSDLTYGSVTDQDGNTYKTIHIGTQTWMAENLRTTKYNDGSAIPTGIEDVEWQDLVIGAYSNYNNATGVDTIATYGRLYNGYAVKTGKLAPKGWHVTTDADWVTLSSYIDDNSMTAGGALKEIGVIHWNKPNTSATNIFGFTALPGGLHGASGFEGIGLSGYWWTSTKPTSSGTYTYYRFMNASESTLNRVSGAMEIGYSVRCVEDI